MIKIMDTHFDEFNADFDKYLNETVTLKILRCAGATNRYRKFTIKTKVIVSYYNEAIELKLPHTPHEFINRFLNLHKQEIIEFYNKIAYLKKHKTIRGYKEKFSNVNHSQDFNAKKTFETIDYYLTELRKSSTPILYTGMTT